MLEFVVALFVGLGASFLSSIAAGGGAIIILPFLLLLGLTPQNAVGTLRMGSLGLVYGSSARFKKSDLVRKDVYKWLLGIALVASFVGPFLLASVDSRVAEVIILVLIISTVVLTLFRDKKFGSKSKKVSQQSQIIGFIIYALIITTQIAFGSGVGVLSNIIIIQFLGLSMLETVATRRYVGLFVVPIQLLLMIYLGFTNFVIGSGLLIGSLVGSYFGTHVAIKKGNIFVRNTMYVAAIVMALVAVLR